MARNLEYKPLLYTTTMRNPGRLKFMLYVLKQFEGQILNDNLATKICGEAIRYGLYRPMKKHFLFEINGCLPSLVSLVSVCLRMKK